MDDSRNNQSGCLEEIFNLLLTFAFLQFFLNLFYPPPKNTLPRENRGQAGA